MIVAGGVGSTYSTFLSFTKYLGYLLCFMLQIIIVIFITSVYRNTNSETRHYICHDEYIMYQDQKYFWKQAISYIKFHEYILLRFPRKSIILQFEDTPNCKQTYFVNQITTLIMNSIHCILAAISSSILFAYYFKLQDIGIKYSYDGYPLLLPTIFIFSLLILISNNIKHASKKYILIFIHMLYILSIIVIITKFSSSDTTIRSNSPNLKHQIILQQDKNKQTVTYYKNPGFFFMSASPLIFPDSANFKVNTVDINWLSDRVYVITLENEEGVIRNSIDSFVPSNMSNLDFHSVLNGIWEGRDENNDTYNLDLYYTQNSNIILNIKDEPHHYSTMQTTYQSGEYIGLHENNNISYCIILNDDWKIDETGKVITVGSIILTSIDDNSIDSIVLHNKSYQKETITMTAETLN